MRLFFVLLPILVLLITLLVTGPLYSQTVYKVTKEDGTVVFTDQAGPGAKPFDLSKVNSATMPRLATPQKNSQSDDQDTPNYAIDVLSPAPEATIRDNQGRVTIAAQLAPRANGQFHLWLNDERIASQQSGVFTLEGLTRGSHRFFITATDNTGKSLASSEPQTFYMHQTSVLINTGTR